MKTKTEEKTQLYPDITFRHLDPSEAITSTIQKRFDHLTKLFADIISCHVAVEGPHHHHRKGNLYRVRVEVMVPGDKVVAGRNPKAHHSHVDVYVAIRDAFNAAGRRLQDYVRVRRRKVKRHSRS